METLIYVSRSCLEPESAAEEVCRIVANAQIANRASDLTGALIFTGVHFAQVLEGKAAPLDALLDALRADPRHRDIRVVARHAIERPLFFDWSMAYSGEPIWVDDHIAPLFADDLNDRADAEALVAQLAVQFALLRRCAT